MQMINSCVIIALLLGTYRLCGKTSLDQMLSHPDSSCMKFIQNSFLRKALVFSKKNYNHRYRNKITISNEHLENKTTKVSNNSKNNDAHTDYEGMINFSQYVESYSCITIDLRDPYCFVWRNSENKSTCQAVFGMAFPIAIVILDLMYLVYTIISASRHVASFSKEIDLIRCAVHILLWFIISFSIMYLLYTWDYAWKHIDFKAKISKRSFVAMIFSITNIALYCFEMFHTKWLYMRIRVSTKPDKMKGSRRRARAGNEPNNRAAKITLHLMTNMKFEGYLLVPISQRV
ncbi:putative integral membrane protein [Acanthocheilonema viteae]